MIRLESRPSTHNTLTNLGLKNQCNWRNIVFMFVLLYSLHLNFNFEMTIFGFAIANGFVIFLDYELKLFVEFKVPITRPYTIYYAQKQCPCALKHNWTTPKTCRSFKGGGHIQNQDMTQTNTILCGSCRTFEASKCITVIHNVDFEFNV